MSKRKKFRTEAAKEEGEKYELDLQNHCLFCLEPYVPTDLKSFDFSVRPLQLLQYFVGTLPENYLSNGDKTICNKTNGRPPTCQSCYNNFEEIQKLHEQIMELHLYPTSDREIMLFQNLLYKEVERLRQVVKEVVPAEDAFIKWRKWNRFTKKLCSIGISPNQVTLTCELVKNIHSLITTDAAARKALLDATQLSDSAQKKFPMNINENIKRKRDDEHGDEFHEWNPDLSLNDAGGNGNDGEICEEQLPLFHLEINHGLETTSTLPESCQESSKSAENSTAVAPLKKKIRKRVKCKGKARVSKAKRNKNVEQTCDLCGHNIPIIDIFHHVKEHVNNYATKCANPSCPFVFSCKLKMLKHLESSTKCDKVASANSAWEATGLKRCKLCNYTFANTLMMGSHLNNHEMEGTMKKRNKKTCPIAGCAEQFLFPQSLEYHLYQHNVRAPTQQECPICSESVELSEMEDHLAQGHQIDEVFRCNHCLFVFDTADAKISHVNSHKTESGVSCDICENCPIKFLRMISLRRHYFNFHSLGTLPAFMCEHCGREFSSFAALKGHKRKEHKDMAGIVSAAYAKVWKCDLCPEGQEFSRGDTLINHKIKVHGEEPLFCKICGDTFLSTSKLKAHLKEHAGTTTLYKCTEDGCRKQYKHRYELKRHIEAKHWKGEQKPYICDICGKGYGLRKSLNSHKNLIHDGMRYVCDVCGQSLFSALNLAKHKLIHTGERPYTCNVCGQAFRQLMVLQCHLKGHETKGDKFKPIGPFEHKQKTKGNNKVRKDRCKRKKKSKNSAKTEDNLEQRTKTE